MATALLLENGERQVVHYKILTDWILETGLTTLGEKGTTSSQSVGAILRKYDEHFQPDSDGFYGLADPQRSKKDISVERALEALKAGRCHQALLKEKDRSIKEQEAVINDLRNRLAKIAEAMIGYTSVDGQRD